MPMIEIKMKVYYPESVLKFNIFRQVDSYDLEDVAKVTNGIKDAIVKYSGRFTMSRDNNPFSPEYPEFIILNLDNAISAELSWFPCDDTSVGNLKDLLDAKSKDSD